MRSLFFLFFFLTVCGNIKSQNRYQLGVLPGLNLNAKINDDWKVNFKAESRQRLMEGLWGHPEKMKYEYVLTDFSILAARKIGLSETLAGGYLLRLRDKALIHRFIQQLTIVKRYDTFRLAHRVSTDQTFPNGESLELRVRYRITAEFSLNGQSVDPKEFYFKLNHEYLNAFQGNKYDLEIRLVPFLGYEFTDHNKLEWGIDYRINSFINTPSRSSFWWSINWFISI